MTSWQFPSKEQWLMSWEAAHAIYAEDIDPCDELLCQALLWQARSICLKENDQD
jgi:hypothetical protein